MKKEKSNIVEMDSTSISTDIVPPIDVIMSMLEDKKKDLEASNHLMQLTASLLERKYRKYKLVYKKNEKGMKGGNLIIREEGIGDGFILQCDTLPDSLAAVGVTHDEKLTVMLFYNRQNQIVKDILVLQTLANMELEVPDCYCKYGNCPEIIRKNII